MKRLEDLDEEDLMEMTASGILTGLKSWLNFGSNIGANTVSISIRTAQVRPSIFYSTKKFTYIT